MARKCGSISSWHRAKRVGDSGEAALAELLVNAGISFESYAGLGWDIEVLICAKKVKVECKHDVMAAETGNLAIEIHNVRKDEPSGLYATKAKFWAVVLTNPIRVFISPVSKLKAYIKKVQPVKTVQKGGDGNSKLLIFEASSILKAVFIQADLLHPAELVKLLRSA